MVPAFTPHDCSCSQRMDHYHLHFVSRVSTGVDLLSLLDCPFQIDDSQKKRGLFKRLEALCPGRKLPCFDPKNEDYRRYSIAAEHSVDFNLPVGDWLERNGIMSILLSPFVRAATVREGVHARVARQFLVVQRHIHEKLRDPISLAHLARLVELHPTYFSDRFLELVGERPLKYLMRYRLERAQYLLLTSHASVKQVANEVGIPDQVYFTRVFRPFLWGLANRISDVTFHLAGCCSTGFHVEPSHFCDRRRKNLCFVLTIAQFVLNEGTGKFAGQNPR